MLPPAEQVDALAAALLSAERTVVLAGQRLDEEGIAEIAAARSEWAARAAAARSPTAAHRALVRLERAGAIAAIISQAGDGLHERAGSGEVVEVYGNVLSVRCERCGDRYGLEEAARFLEASPDGVPRCTTPGCAYPVRPHGTLWNEPLPGPAIERAWELAGGCDLLVVIDSDLRTAPIRITPAPREAEDSAGDPALWTAAPTADTHRR